MLTVVCWMWNNGFIDYTAEHVNSLARMARRHIPEMSRFVCITDEPGQYSSDVEVMPTPDSAARISHLQTIEGMQKPSCHRRLWMFSDEARCLGERVMLLDIDTVITGDMSAMVARHEPFVGWCPAIKWGTERVSGAMYLLSTGARTGVWTGFAGSESIRKARLAGYRGSDQAWMSYCLQGEKVWPDGAGIYSVRDLRRREKRLPYDARIVHFNGPVKPWEVDWSWVQEARA